VGVAGIVFVVRTLVNKWDEVSEAFRQMDALPLVASLMLALGALTIIGSTWSTILRHRNHHIPTSSALAWYFTGQLGKYVPGGIWAIVGRAEMAVRGGTNRTDAYVSTGISMMTTYLASVVVISVGSILSWTYPAIGIALLVGGILGLALYAQPPIHMMVLTVSKKFLPNGIILAPWQVLLRYTTLHTPAWILMSLSTSITASAFGAEVSIAEMFFFTASSWLVGFIAIGVPGGIGVRESVFTALATPAIGAPLAVSIALASRFVFILADVVGALVSNAVVRLRSHKTIST
jgi:glycosyltransferase 2 family protein